MNITNVDYMVEEYLLYRGFTQTFRCLENEKSHDRSRAFQENKIVEQIFQFLINFEMESFITLWDFLSKRFFLHLDQEHLEMIGGLKADLLKFYVVNSIKTHNKAKAHDFFATYSQEILSESGDSMTHSFRSWYVIVYLDKPEKDPEFAMYFTASWMDSLRCTLNNFLSIVLSNAPPPKLMLLERWFRSDVQSDVRNQLKMALNENELLLTKAEGYEKRIESLHTVILEMSKYILDTEVNRGNISGKSTSNGSRAPSDSSNDPTNDGAGMALGGYGEEESEQYRLKVVSVGQFICKLSQDCKLKDQQLLGLLAPAIEGVDENNLKAADSLGNHSEEPVDDDIALFGNERLKLFKDIIIGKVKLNDNINSEPFRNKHSGKHKDINILNSKSINNTSIEEMEAQLVTQLHSWLNLIKNQQ